MKQLVLLALLMLLAAFPRQAESGEKADDLRRRDTYESLEIFSNVLTLLQQHYVDSVDTGQAVEGAINGMLSSLDPHSSYLQPEDLEELQDETRGSFSGIGIEITVKDGSLTVVSPIEGTPAALAGIRAGDQIIKVDGQLTKGMTLMDAVKKMRGAKGSQVTIAIFRESWTEIREFTLTRADIPLLSVKSMVLENGLVYIRLTSFQADTTRDFRKALADLEKKGDIKGMILDLRNNPGGLLDQAVKIADVFLEEGIIVSTRGRDGEQNVDFEAHRDTNRFAFPLVVLVNEGSASASEIVAGALKDHGRAVIAGTPTFGKGSVQTVIPMPGGAGLRLTTARYYTPSGASIQATGIKPDIHIALLQSMAPDTGKAVESLPLREKDLPHHFRNEGEEKNRDAGQAGSGSEAGEKKSGEDTGSRAPEEMTVAQRLQADNQLRTALVILKSLLLAGEKSPLPDQEESPL